LRVKLGAPYFEVTLSATGAIRVRSRWGERDDKSENGAREAIHGVSLGGLVWCSSGSFEQTAN
jgi:hypothetical protein